MKPVNHLRIAVDGESGSGKSYASKIIGKKYKCYILNSGLAYRYSSYLIIKHSPKKIIPFLKKKFKNLNYKKLTRINKAFNNNSNYRNDLIVGQKIIHNVFGKGEIKNIDTSDGNQKIKVNFQEYGDKLLLTKFAKFKIIM